MYTVIGKYYIIPGRVEEWMRQVQEGLVPLVRQAPGFIGHYDLEVRNDEVVSISIFETQAASEATLQQTAAWFLKQLVPLLQTFPEITPGHVRVSSELISRSSPS